MPNVEHSFVLYALLLEPGGCLRAHITLFELVELEGKKKPEVDVDSLLQTTLPPGPVEGEVDTCEALVLAGSVSELSNKATLEHSDFALS